MRQRPGLRRSPDPLSWIREGEGDKEEGESGKGNGREGRGEIGKGRRRERGEGEGPDQVSREIDVPVYGGERYHSVHFIVTAG